MASRSIILIGPRGSGKSTVGRLLAKALDLPFADADAELEARAGRTIREIFATDGEVVFREMESRLLGEILARGPLIVATGGGVVLRPENRQRLRGADFVVWLTGTPEALLARIQADPESAARRPNLRSGGIEEIAEILAEREPYYRECAHVAISTDGRSPEEIANDILHACKNSSSPTDR